MLPLLAAFWKSLVVTLSYWLLCFKPMSQNQYADLKRKNFILVITRWLKVVKPEKVDMASRQLASWEGKVAKAARVFHSWQVSLIQNLPCCHWYLPQKLYTATLPLFCHYTSRIIIIWSHSTHSLWAQALMIQSVRVLHNVGLGSL